MNKKEVNGMMF